MNGKTCTLAMALGLASTQPIEAGTLTLSLSDPHGLVAGSHAFAIREEISGLLRAPEAALHWTEGTAPAAGASNGEVNIVFTPSDPSGPGWGLEPGVMGVYLANGGSSAVFVFYRRIRSVLGLPPPGERMLEPRERRDLNRALARVAVHELIHRLDPDLPHAELGLMRGDLDRDTLTRQRASLDRSSREAVARALSEQ